MTWCRWETVPKPLLWHSKSWWLKHLLKQKLFRFGNFLFFLPLSRIAALHFTWNEKMTLKKLKRRGLMKKGILVWNQSKMLALVQKLLLLFSKNHTWESASGLFAHPLSPSLTESRQTVSLGVYYGQEAKNVLFPRSFSKTSLFSLVLRLESKKRRWIHGQG